MTTVQLTCYYCRHEISFSLTPGAPEPFACTNCPAHGDAQWTGESARITWLEPLLLPPEQIQYEVTIQYDLGRAIGERERS